MSDYVKIVKRAKAVAARCYQRLDAAVSQELIEAKVIEAGAVVHVIPRGGPDLSLTHRQIEMRSVEQLADALIYHFQRC